MLGILHRFDFYDDPNQNYAFVTILDDGIVIANSTQAIDISSVTDQASFEAAGKALLDQFASDSSVTLDDYSFGGGPVIPSGLGNAPQAAIANAPADAVTNYNVITTLLGTLTGAVNTANTKQNEIATKLNSLLAELRTLGLIAS